MIGAIIGDIVGSIYEFNNIKTKDFRFFDPDCFFTDDSIMTIAICNALLKCKGNYKNLENIVIKEMRKFGKLYPNAGYGNSFKNWLRDSNVKAYNSYGNGSAMRISAVAYFAKNMEQLKELSYKVTAVTHNHPEGIKGAEATAICIYMALNGFKKDKIKETIEKQYYKLDFNYEDLVKNYTFNETCQNTVPQAIYCFLISKDFEDAIRTGVSIGGDTDTLCAIIGAIAQAYYGIPYYYTNTVKKYLDKNLLKVLNKFNRTMLKTNEK